MFSPPRTPNGPGSYIFSPVKTPKETRSPSFIKAIEEPSIQETEKVIIFSRKIVSFITWDQKTSDPRSPTQISVRELSLQRNKQIQSLTEEKASLLQEIKRSSPSLELAACVERLTKKASLPHSSTASYASLPPPSRDNIDDIVDLLVQREIARKNTNSVLRSDFPTQDLIAKTLERVLLVSMNGENSKNTLRSAPKETQKSLAPIIDDIIISSRQMIDDLSPVILASIKTLPGLDDPYASK